MVDNRYHKGYVFSAACIGMLLFGIVMISLGSILPEVTEKFKINEARTGFLLTLLPSGILAGSLVFGPLVDWLSYKKILIGGSVLTLLGLEGIVFSEALLLLHLSVFCTGIGGGILNGITNALVSEISEEDHSANLSLLGVFFGVGALGTPVILGFLKGVYSFEAIFALLGISIVVPILFFLIIRFPKSAETKGIPIKEGLKMVKNPLLLLFGFILFFQSGIEGLTNNWTTTYLEIIKEIKASNALFILSSFVGAITITRIVLGKILRIFNPLKVMVIGFIIALIGCLLILQGSSYVMLVVGMVTVGMGIAAGFPVILGYVGQIYTHLSGTAFSIVVTIALIGNVISNYLMGQVSQYHGVGVLPYFIIIAILTALILLYITNKKYHTKIN
ncbi:MFS transporter [Fulvivirgaceae bacterium BMA12]|uniref:MFS transporter n=1 Tax=Agaribacillus aureus TaxID=3051825 RepID=A0ABT8KZA7_9BACT|nr:MFS transporter [Fulvivirgaceae bacterium BMA12]